MQRDHIQIEQWPADSAERKCGAAVKPGAATVFFPQDKVRPSQDGLYHACISLSAGTPICLYVPYGA